MQPNEQSFDRPIPGMSLTHELGARPWQQPADIPNVDDAAEYYITQIADDAFAKNLIHTMKTGVPLTTIANSLQLAGVMEGKHSVDVGILMIPVIMETMMLIGDAAGVDYDTGLADNKELDQNVVTTATIGKLLQSDVDNKNMVEPVQEIEDEPLVENTGLMSRRT
tara:strand:- start:434 stop:931 length:498 start_codon:yes stop_codon:yes gene_type:complete